MYHRWLISLKINHLHVDGWAAPTVKSHHVPHPIQSTTLFNEHSRNIQKTLSLLWWNHVQNIQWYTFHHNNDMTTSEHHNSIRMMDHDGPLNHRKCGPLGPPLDRSPAIGNHLLLRPSHAADVGQVVRHDGGKHGTEEHHAPRGAHGQPSFRARPACADWRWGILPDWERHIGKKGERWEIKQTEWVSVLGNEHVPYSWI